MFSTFRSGLSNDFIWYSDEDGPWVHKPTGKGERVIILNAITKDGWVEGAELFTKWFIEQLLPNIPNNSLIVMDNASIHNTLSKHSAPSANSKKDDIGAMLKQNGIPVQDDCLKAELVEILKRIAPVPTYAPDSNGFCG